jgi:acetylornithine deacetylase/succinyl-diaminopimelate desuccinylase-like protein
MTTRFSGFVESNRDRMLSELTSLLSIPSVSTLPAHNSDCRKAADWVAAELRRLGCPTVELIGDATHPVVWATGKPRPGKRTVLIYGHYDVQPPDPLNEWTSPPFEPRVRDGKLYARGASDDKGQVFAILKAVEALGEPPVNFRFLIEGEEEYGSKVITGVLKREPERTRADVVLIADMAYFGPAWPAVYTALRGICYAEVTVRTAKTDLHSGTYGGAAPNAHDELVRLLGALKGKDGKINVPGLYQAVKRPSAAELRAWKKLPFKEARFQKDEVQARALTGWKKYSVLERIWALPTFEIHGIMGGFTGEGAKTVIPSTATAKVSLRLVPNQSYAAVQRQLTQAVKRLAPKHVEASVRFIHGADPVQVDIGAPPFEALSRAFREVVGRGTVPARAGGSIPIVPTLGQTGAPVVLTGIGLPDDRLHAPDEKLDLRQLWDGIQVFARFFELMGS